MYQTTRDSWNEQKKLSLIDFLSICFALAGIALPLSAVAADNIVLLDIDDAMSKYQGGDEYVDGFQFYFAGWEHPVYDAELGEHQVTLRTSQTKGPKSQSQDHYLESEMRKIRKLQDEETCLYLFARYAGEIK